MAIALTHTTVAVGTNNGNGEIGKTQWNEAHTLSMATARLLGRTTAAAGAVEELTVGTGLTLATGDLSVTAGTYAAASHTHAASAIASGTIDTARLGSGTANSTTYLRGDQTWAAISASGDVTGPASSTDNALARFDGITGKLLQNSSGATLSDNWALSLAGATVTTSEPLLNLTQTWNAGAVTFTGIKSNITDTASASASKLFDLQVASATKFAIEKGVGGITLKGDGAGATRFNGDSGDTLCLSFYSGEQGAVVPSTGFLGFMNNNSGNVSNNIDIRLTRVAAGIVGIRSTNTTTGGVLSFIERTAPSAPAADGCYIYAQDNGAGKTQLMALFSSGAAQQLAIQP